MTHHTCEMLDPPYDSVNGYFSRSLAQIRMNPLVSSAPIPLRLGLEDLIDCGERVFAAFAERDRWAVSIECNTFLVGSSSVSGPNVTFDDLEKHPNNLLQREFSP